MGRPVKQEENGEHMTEKKAISQGQKGERDRAAWHNAQTQEQERRWALIFGKGLKVLTVQDRLTEKGRKAKSGRKGAPKQTGGKRLCLL